MKHFPVLFLSALLLSFKALYAQNIGTTFGKNRVQFEQHKWQRYSTENFVFSYTEDNEDLMRFVVPIAEQSYFELKALLEYRVRNAIELVVYSDFSDYNQSNMGDSRPRFGTSGLTRVMENKILIYFDGNHHHLHCQIREGIARVLVNRMLFGSSLQEVVQNSVLMRLPEWFTEGIVAFASEDWNTQLDDRLREAFLSGRYSNFIDLAAKEPRLAGHSLFHFIAHQYNNSYVSNLLYLTRINRSVESGFLYVFGTSFYGVVGSNWFNYYSDRYTEDNQNRRFPNKGELTLRQHPRLQFQHIRLSPTGKQVVYVERVFGKYWVVLHDIDSDSRRVLASGGLRYELTDYEPNYPLPAWSKSGDKLWLLTERADKIYIQSFNPEQGQAQGKPQRLTGVERIVGLDAHDGTTFVASGLQGGRSDLYFGDFKGGALRPINQDKYDDLYPVSLRYDGARGIAFASNRNKPSFAAERSDTTQPLGTLDLFFYNLETKALVRLTETEFADETHPAAAPGEALAYLSDNSGMFNRYLVQNEEVLLRYDRRLFFADGSTSIVPESDTASIARADSSAPAAVYERRPQSAANTDYSRSIVEQHSNKNKVADLLYREGRYRLFVRELQKERETNPAPTRYHRILEGADKAALGKVATEKKADKINNTRRPDSSAADRLVARELKLLEQEMKADTLPPSTRPDTGRIDIDNYLFQSEFDNVAKPSVRPDTVIAPVDVEPVVLIETDDGTIQTTPMSENRGRKRSPSRIDWSKSIFRPVVFNPSESKPYKSIFKVEELAFQIDNQPLFRGLNMYLGGNYPFPPVGLMFKTGFMDVYENFHLDIGIRLPVNFRGMEYFINLRNNKGRLNQTYSVYRRSRLDDVNLVDTTSGYSARVKARNVQHIFQADLCYPFNKFHSLHLVPGFYSDRLAVVAEDVPSLVVPVYLENRLSTRLEYVFDNTLDIRINAKKGTAVKLYADFFQSIAVQTKDSFRVRFDGGQTLALGWDVRQYFSPDNKMVFAFRFAGATSFGKQKMLYSMGGVENWVFPRYTGNITLPEGSAHAYNVAVGNMRGFRNNVRNGSSFALINAEWRLPFMDYLSVAPTRNSFLRSLQLVTFLDVGTAWQGLSPFAKDNPLNTTIVDPNTDPNTLSPVVVQINYFRRPIVTGFGFGLRSVVLGYFIRLDCAWGAETGKVNPAPQVYFSLGTDF